MRAPLQHRTSEGWSARILGTHHRCKEFCFCAEEETFTVLPAEAALKVLTRYPNEGPSMTWVERHRAAWPTWVEAIGPPTPIGRKFRGAIEETLFEDCAPSATRDPPLVLRAAVGTITLHENCCYLGNQKTQLNLRENTTNTEKKLDVSERVLWKFSVKFSQVNDLSWSRRTHVPWVQQPTETWVAVGAGRAAATSW